MPRLRLLLAALLCACAARAHDSAASAMSESARAFLEALTAEERAQAGFAVTDQEREDWAFVPRSRRGVPLRDLTPPQRARALALLRSALSTRGAHEAEAIIALEPILRELEGASYRDAGLYYLTVFGEAGRAPWGWRFEGHHLSLNVTIPDEHHVVVTPNFFGANPATIPSGPRGGQRTLAAEEDLARALVKSLDAGQRRVALLSPRAPRDILTGDEREVRPLEPAGLPAARLTPPQREQLAALLEVYVGRFRDDISAPTRERMLAGGLEGVHFAWAGGLEPGEGHYYRLQGPSFLIEYDNTQDGANHIHTTFRDFARDFGRDLLREHYRAAHGN